MPGIVICRRDGTILHAAVDDEDADLAELRWSMAGGKGSGKYLSRRADGMTTYLHRVIAYRMGMIESFVPARGSRGRWSVSIDHENGNKLDNRRSNLRLADRRAQMLNQNDGLRSDNRSGVRGVSYVKSRGRWYACAYQNGRTIYLGLFPTREEAIEARRAVDLTI